MLAPESACHESFVLDAFRLIRLVGPSLRKVGLAGGSVLLTISRLDGSFGLSGLEPAIDPTSGALAGLAKTARAEWPEVHCKALDLARSSSSVEDVAERIVQELFRSGPAEVGLSEQGNNQVVLLPVGEATKDHGVGPVLRPGDVVVVTGGARGVTAEVAFALASSYQPRLVLLGRTPAPDAEPAWLQRLHSDAEILRALRSHGDRSDSPQVLSERLRLVQAQREIRSNLARIEAAGSRVSYHAVDVRDQGALEGLLDQVRRDSGPIRGLIHGAGVLADRRIEDLTDSQFAHVFETKVQGLRAIIAGLGSDELRVLVLFSSSTARFGRVGQAAYAAANEFLNKWAERESRRRAGCRVVAFNWGPWDGGMVTDALKPMFEREGLGLIPLGEGARLVVSELTRQGEGPAEMVVLARPPSTRDSSASDRGQTHAPVSSNGRLELVFERNIDLGSLPVIGSHVIDGHAVVPLALIMEWLAEGAVHRHPGLVVRGVEELRLFKGLVLRDHKPMAVSIRVGKRVRHQDAHRVTVELHGAFDKGREIVHARCEVVVADRHREGDRFLVEPELVPLATDREAIYRGILFHGPAMQAIQRVEGCDEHSISAWVSTSPPPATWIERPLRQSWLTDPLAIDAAFQLMVLWTHERMGSGSLPTAVGAYRQFRRSFPTDGVRVLASVRQFSDLRAVADIEFLDAGGSPVALIEAYECVIDSSLNQAFRRNRLSLLEAASS